MTEKLPSVVIVGRPNVGKSTIFNRLTGTRRSIVTNEPGITRDRIYGTATWQGRTFEVVDTGGIVPDDKAAIPREILRQAQVAIEGASQLLLVVDVRAGLTPLDSELANLLRRTGKPLAILANKVDTQMQESLAAPFYGLSNDVFPVSAEHGYGFDTLLESITNSDGLHRRRPGFARGGGCSRPDQRCNHRSSQCREIDDAQPAGRRGALDRLRYARNDARRRGHNRAARGAHVPVC